MVSIVYGVWASTFDLKQVDNIPERSAVFDMDGKFYARLAGENRVTVHLEDVADYFVKALMAREDSRFFSHHGIDPVGIARAMVRNIAARPHSRRRQHAHPATGPQYLPRWASHAEPAPEAPGGIPRDPDRAEFHQEADLEAYMNRIYFGEGVYGIETASQAYFGKHAKDLTFNSPPCSWR